MWCVVFVSIQFRCWAILALSALIVWPMYTSWHSEHFMAYVTRLSLQVSGLLYLGIIIFTLQFIEDCFCQSELWTDFTPCIFAFGHWVGSRK